MTSTGLPELKSLADRFAHDPKGLVQHFRKEFSGKTHFDYGKALLNQAELFRQSGYSALSKPLDEAAVRIFRQIENRTEEANALNNLALDCKNLGEFDKALRLYQKTLAIDRALGQEEWTSFTLNNMALLYDDRGEFDRAITLFKQSIDIDTRFQRPFEVARTLNNLGQSWVGKGFPDEGIRCYEQAVAIYRNEPGRDINIARTTVNLGFAWLRKNRFEQARLCFEAALAVFEQMGEAFWAAKCHSGFGSLDIVAGRYREAIEHFLTAYRLYQSRGYLRDMNRSLASIADVHSFLGDHRAALFWHEQILITARRMRSAMAEMAALNGQATALARFGERARAISLLKKALRISEKNGIESGISTLALNLGLQYLELGNSKQALIYIEKGRRANARTEKNKETEQYATLYLALLFMHESQKAKAFSFLKKSLRLARRLNAGQAEMTTMFNLARWHVHFGKDSAALYWARKAAVHAERDLEYLFHESLMTSWQGKLADVYRILIVLQYEKGRRREAFDLAQRAKSRAQTRMLSGLARPANQPLAESQRILLEEEKVLFNALQAARKTDVMQMKNTFGWHELMKRLTELQKEISIFDPVFVQTRRGQPLDFWAIKARL